jgi:outer membrane phospholipase A
MLASVLMAWAMPALSQDVEPATDGVVQWPDVSALAADDAGLGEQTREWERPANPMIVPVSWPFQPPDEPEYFDLSTQPSPDAKPNPSDTQPVAQNARLDFNATTRPTTRMSTTAAATQPEAASAAAGNFPTAGGSFGLNEFALHFAPYEPMYFVGGWKAPNVKFQFSLRYRILTPTGPLATEYPLLKGFNIAYSQTSLWDLSNPNNPFFYDSSYRPEIFYYLENVPDLKLPQDWQFGAQFGLGHESNGQGGVNERSMNIAYIRPIVTLTDPSTKLFVTLAPKIYGYLGDLSHNPDIARYRGYADLMFTVGQLDGLQLSTLARVGYKYDRASAQFDLTYPLTKILGGNVDLALDAQYFIGYGDTLITYNQRIGIFRLGVSLVR